MSHLVTIKVPGPPMGKERPRFRKEPIRLKRGGISHTYPAERTKAYERTIGLLANRAMHGRAPFTIPLRVVVYAYLENPNKKPDGDNLLKTVGDAGNEIIWNDDAQIVEATIVKLASSSPRLEIFVSEWDGP